MVAGAVGALMEKSAIAWTVFFGVPLEAYFCCWRRGICGMAILIIT